MKFGGRRNPSFGVIEEIIRTLLISYLVHSSATMVIKVVDNIRKLRLTRILHTKYLLSHFKG